MDLDSLTTSYRRSVMAKIQARECTTFGGGLVDMFKSTIAAHEAAEAEYIEAELKRRASEVTDLKAISHK